MEGIWYAGRRCSSFSGTRSPGTDPDFYTVTMPWAYDAAPGAAFPQITGAGALFGNPADPAKWSGSGTAGTRSRGEEDGASQPTAEAAANRAIEAVGDIVVVQDFPLYGNTLRIQNLFLRDDGFIVRPVGDGAALATVELMDVRGLWRKGGEAWGAFNMRVQYENAVSPEYDKSTLNRDGSRVTVRQMITELIRVLPGGCSVVFPEENSRANKLALDNVSWNGLQAVEVLGDLLRTAEMELHLGLDGKTCYVASFSRDGVNFAGVDDYPYVARDYEKNSFSLSASRALREDQAHIRYVPNAVRVAAAAHYQEYETRLVPVGVHRFTKQIVPLHEAAASHGLTLAQLGAILLLPEDAREKAAHEAPREDGAQARAVWAEIAPWAFRMFQLPPDKLHRVPIETLSLAEVASELRAKRQTTAAFPPLVPALRAITGKLVKTLPQEPNAVENALLIDRELRALGEFGESLTSPIR